MSILDKTKIGDSVQINLEQTKDRLTKEIIDALIKKINEVKLRILIYKKICRICCKAILVQACYQ